MRFRLVNLEILTQKSSSAVPFLLNQSFENKKKIQGGLVKLSCKDLSLVQTRFHLI